MFIILKIIFSSLYSFFLNYHFHNFDLAKKLDLFSIRILER